MAQTTVLNLIPQTAHPNNSSGIDIFGTKQQGAACILANRSLQTITWHVSSTFQGLCSIEASLVTDPQPQDWVTVYTIDTDMDKDGYYNLTGNFVWLRGVVTNWTQGTIQLITVSY